MVALNSVAHETKTDVTADFDAIIIGAGVSGLYQLTIMAALVVADGDCRALK